RHRVGPVRRDEAPAHVAELQRPARSLADDRRLVGRAYVEPGCVRLQAVPLHGTEFRELLQQALVGMLIAVSIAHRLSLAAADGAVLPAARIGVMSAPMARYELRLYMKNACGPALLGDVSCIDAADEHAAIAEADRRVGDLPKNCFGALFDA